MRFKNLLKLFACNKYLQMYIYLKLYDSRYKLQLRSRE